MAITWANLLTSLRYELDDVVAGNYLWSDEALFVWLGDALSDYSVYNPLVIVADISLAEASDSYDLPSDNLGVLSVQSPLGTYLQQRRVRPGVVYRSRTETLSYELVGDTITLNSSATSVILSYRAIHPSPETCEDYDFELTFPVRDTELIRLYICAKAYGRMRSQQASLDRFKLGSGNRTDNPLIPAVNELMDEYYRKINLRYGGGVITLSPQ